MDASHASDAIIVGAETVAVDDSVSGQRGPLKSVEVQCCMSVNGALSLHTVGRVGRVIGVEGGYLLNEVFWVVKPDCSGHSAGRLGDLTVNS